MRAGVWQAPFLVAEEFLASIGPAMALPFGIPSLAGPSADRVRTARMSAQ
jgi:hypothetical protein